MTAEPDVEDLLRHIAPQVLGALARRYGSFADADDAVQEAMLDAVTVWRDRGVPADPHAWLLTVSRRRLVDQWRSEEARRRRERVAWVRAAGPPDVPHTDDSLRLLFLCCHPALTRASAIALTLRAVGGLTTGEIARAFLVPEATMAQRISRAKQRIRASDLPFEMPTAAEWEERLGAVLHVLYLVFNEGYASGAGPDMIRTTLSGEALRLTRMLRSHHPEEPEVAGLLALMVLTDARRPARTGPDGELVALADQDRTRWDDALVTEGIRLVSDTLPRGAVGPYQLQAAIAAVHAEAATAAQTDWPQILALYGLLERMTGSPVVALNRAVATAMVHGPGVALGELDVLADHLPGHRHRLAAVRAHLLQMSGDLDGAVAQLVLAAGLTTSEAERRYLTTRAGALRGRPRDGVAPAEPTGRPTGGDPAAGAG